MKPVFYIGTVVETLIYPFEGATVMVTPHAPAFAQFEVPGV